MIPVVYPENAGELSRMAGEYLATLEDAGLLEGPHKLTAALVRHLAVVADRTSRGYAAAQVAREFREAMALLPVIAGPASDEVTDVVGAILADLARLDDDA